MSSFDERVAISVKDETLRARQSTKRLLTVAWFALAALAGCEISNDVTPVAAPGYPPASNRAIVIFGVGVEGIWGFPEFPVRFQEYDVSKQSTTGNCFKWNRMQASVPVVSREIRYFAFDVPAGYYAGGGGADSAYRGRLGSLAFEVPPGQVVYLGDFVYASDKTVDLRSNLAAARAATKSLFPKVGEPILAKTMPVHSVGVFVCTP